jgi:hypothetical protein
MVRKKLSLKEKGMRTSLWCRVAWKNRSSHSLESWLTMESSRRSPHKTFKMSIATSDLTKEQVIEIWLPEEALENRTLSETSLRSKSRSYLPIAARYQSNRARTASLLWGKPSKHLQSKAKRRRISLFQRLRKSRRLLKPLLLTQPTAIGSA